MSPSPIVDVAANEQSSATGVSGYDSVNNYTTLPNGTAYRLDADMYHAEDLDGVMEGLLESGNLNDLIMQNSELGGLLDPTPSSSNVLAVNGTRNHHPAGAKTHNALTSDQPDEAAQFLG